MCDLPHGVVKMPRGGLGILSRHRAEIQVRSAFLVGPAEEVGLIPDSEEAIQIGISIGCRTSRGAERCCPDLTPEPPHFEQCLSRLGHIVWITFMHFKCLQCLEYEKLLLSSN